MQIITNVAIFLYQLQCSLINHKFLLKATPLRSLVIGIGDIADGDALRTIARTYPVGIGQIDTDCR